MPVTDVEASARWYARASACGCDMESRRTRTNCVVWSSSNQSRCEDRLARPFGVQRSPRLTRFSVVAIELASARAVHAMAEWCAENAVEIRGIRDIPGGAVMDLQDPDGAVIHLHHVAGSPPFPRRSIRFGRSSGTYLTPRLTGIRQPMNPARKSVGARRRRGMSGTLPQTGSQNLRVTTRPCEGPGRSCR